ncbi:MAG TPA: prepilin-type N-terminal cleavage/methylation domain-containing protein, partial [Vicinamibacterales bacterium]|nr:prepilin-type N-terminal cleavage/methylation domain-containing protein [Vicinamibacterales bacterium]
TARALGESRGFTLVEVLVASMILVVALLTMASMFPVGYKQIADGGRMTMAVSGARHILEDVGDVPFANISNLNGVDTATNTGVIAGLAGTESAIARRWRYMLAGSGNGFTFTAAETAAWGTPQPFAGRAQVTVANTSATLRTVTVTVTVPGLPGNVTMSTVIVRFF